MTTRTGSKRWGNPGLWIGLSFGLTAFAGCTRPGGPYEFSSSQSEFPIPDSGAPPPPIAVQTGPTCTPAQTSASNAFPARTTIVGATQGGGAQDNIYRTSDLFSLFNSECGGCHVSPNTDGGFQVAPSNFSTVVSGAMGTLVYNLITSNDTSGNPATSVMPPYGVAYNQRTSSDAVVQLATLLNQWLMQGSPATSFTLGTQTVSASAGYAMSASLGAQLTNIGSCVPNRAAVGTSADAMNQLDSFFAQATQLPATLDQTDLVSMDSATLAQTAVISYAPTYPLWSDNAGKMRYVRVPVGQSIVFDKATQKFSIPPNTRFYKTFLKQVTDANGNATYRKIETRLIVSRPDSTKADGSAQQNALFGTYIWNADESQATLSNQPLRNNEPFADQIFTYITDEAKDQAIIASNPASIPGAEDAAKITRHYAVPGSTRCMQCHMGSPSEAFVLGFTPLQVARRPDGEGGIYEPAAGDELTQVQRLIDYGVISGLTSQADILPLEEAEGTRQPRNQYELKAQAYMVGNCAHCHNPRGFPSIRQPAVSPVLIFLPGSGPNEGIFQFSLDTMSPIRNRGVNQDVPIPYITPSLYDYPSDNVIAKYFCQDLSDPNCNYQWILAPWRSLIYRNTDTPYDYFDDYAPFPHMPLNTSGYDCRVAKLMGDWMVSIPSKVKNPSMPQNLLPPQGTFAGSNANTDPQPYEEVHPGDPDYQAAVGAAGARLEQYHTSGFRYDFCPSSYTDDIIDPVIAAQANANVTVTSDVGLGTRSTTDPTLLVMPPLAPIRPDYVALDDTDPPGPWLPRRPDWESALKNPDATALTAFVTAEAASESLTNDQIEDLTNVLTALESVTLDGATTTALTKKYPFGLWSTKTPGCNFSGVPTFGSYTGAADRPQWMSVVNPVPSDSAPVFVESSGAAIFTTICFNCHGTNADGQGLLADEISALTGGDARVADFRDGFLGPVSAPGMNRALVFGDAATTLGVTVDDLSSRYMAWMALGGTNKHLPQDVLNEVTLAPVLGVVRDHVSLEGTPDMLRLGLNICEQLVGSDDEATEISLQNFTQTGLMRWSNYTGMVDSNGDAEMWLRLCNLGNRQIVRALDVTGSWTAGSGSGSLFAKGQQLYWARSLPTATSPTGDDWYGANPVMDPSGNIQTSVTSDNLFPMCVRPPTTPAQLAIAQQALQASPVLGKNVIPFCPDGFAVPAHQLLITSDNNGNTDFVEGRQWAARGAINAALAVFLYLEQMESDPTKQQPLYTQCNLLGGQQ
jgi:hypothetical protein